MSEFKIVKQKNMSCSSWGVTVTFERYFSANTYEEATKMEAMLRAYLEDIADVRLRGHDRADYISDPFFEDAITNLLRAVGFSDPEETETKEKPAYKEIHRNMAAMLLRAFRLSKEASY